MRLYITRKLRNIPGASYRIDNHGNIIVTKGKADSYLCLSAHIDTVHKYNKNYKVFYNEKKDKLYSNTGIGGDDKCGIYAILSLLASCRKPMKAVFFSREECGCVGSRGMQLDFFDDVGMLIGIDRRGNSDLITNYMGRKTISKECEGFLLPLAKKFKYTETSGLITDVFTLQNRLPASISAINLSCGYHAPHSQDEYIIVNQLYRAIELVRSVLEAYDNKTIYHWKAPELPRYNTYSRYDIDLNKYAFTQSVLPVPEFVDMGEEDYDLEDEDDISTDTYDKIYRFIGTNLWQCEHYGLTVNDMYMRYCQGGKWVSFEKFKEIFEEVV